MTSQSDKSPFVDLAQVRQELLAHDWDVLIDERVGEIAARLEPTPTPGIWTLVVDRSGRFRFTATRDAAPPMSSRLAGQRCDYQLLLEEQRVLTVTGRLDRAADLGQVLAELGQLSAWANQPKLDLDEDVPLL